MTESIPQLNSKTLSSISEETLYKDPLHGSINSQVELWDSINGSKVAQLGGHAQAVQSVAVSADGSVVTSGSLNGEIKVWRIQM